MTFFEELKNQTQAEVHVDEVHRKIYSVDASIYEITPLGIAIPKSTSDLLKIMQLAFKHRIPVIPRGAATGITGGCIGAGLVIDLSKYLNRILTINLEQEYALCEPGVVQDQLNQALAPFGYRLGPDTSTGNRATLGGMLANNSAGSHSLFYGSMRDHVEEVEMALADGTLLKFGALNEKEWARKCNQEDSEGQLYRNLSTIRSRYATEIERDFPKTPRRSSGYNIDHLLNYPLNLSKIITGSEGTLGIVTSIKVSISKKLRQTGVCILYFTTINEGMDQIPEILQTNPIALEMIDDKILETGRKAPFLQGKTDWLEGNPKMIFVAEFEGANLEEIRQKIATLQAKNIGYASKAVLDPLEIKSIWEVRKSGLGLLLSKKTYSRAIAFIEDLSIPPERLGAFMRLFLPYLKSVGKEAGIYGHVGSGCMHIRPYIDLRQPEEVNLMETIMEEVSGLVLAHQGVLSGEHGDGIIRAWTTEKMFGKSLYQAFVEVKAAFDPRNLMNPGKIIQGQPLLENLRLSPETRIQAIPTFLDFSKEGGFSLAADLCNGNGMCRKKEGIMCPSFQASLDEYDSTRARAQTLRAIINDRMPLDKLTSHEVQDVLDLCLECKGCKTECPSQIDMAKMKAELLYQFQEKHGYSLRSRLFAHFGSLNRLASRIPKVSNWFLTNSKWLLTLIGITPKRSLPALAPETFSSWFGNHSQTPSAKKVVLYTDTYTQFNEPEIGKAAVKVLNALGYEVIVPPWTCCGRPAFSKGFLRQSQAMAQKVIDQLLPYAHLPIIGLEPSCLLMIKDDFPSFALEKTALITKQCVTFDEFISTHIRSGELPLRFKSQNHSVLFHGHCHQKALIGTKASLNTLKAIPGFSVQEIASGCCGMAGSFGYEKEHYDFSMKIGSLKLFPAIQGATPSTLFVADGISCRSQIAHGTGKKAKHLAEILADSLLDAIS